MIDADPAANTRFAEELKRKFLTQLREGRFEKCDMCQQWFDLAAVAFFENSFVCRECQPKFIDRKAVGLFASSEKTGFPNCPLVRTNVSG